MHLVIAADKFKGSLTAAQVADAVRLGVLDADPDAEVTVFPVADGGDGTVAAAVAAGFTEVRVEVAGPTGKAVSAPYALAGDRAVVELAAACGLELLPDGVSDPLGASTYGLGQVLADAIDRGAAEIVLGLGGSASTDGGAGMAQALGARLLDETRTSLPRGGAALHRLHELDLTELSRRLRGVRVLVASDVDNPLLGPDGAAAVFGPQKGADPDQVRQMDDALKVWAAAVARTIGRDDDADHPGAGAAGGTGFAALALFRAELRPGIDLLLELLDFDAAVSGARLVVTGEGSLDEQTLRGKAPVGVAAAAGRAGVTTVAVAGRCLLDTAQLAAAGIAAVYPLSALEPDLGRSIAQAPALLRAVGRRIADDWLR